MFRALKIIVIATAFSMALASQGSAGDARSLKLYHTHTGKSLTVTYYENGRYQPAAMRQLRRFLADWRNEQQLDLDPKLFDILWQIQRVTGGSDTFEVISAYRSPETNSMLRSRSSGVAKKSQHLVGKAIDVRLRNVDLDLLHKTATELKLGGVGFYPNSDFVHVDTGRVRYW